MIHRPPEIAQFATFGTIYEATGARLRNAIFARACIRCIREGFVNVSFVYFFVEHVYTYACTRFWRHSSSTRRCTSCTSQRRSQDNPRRFARRRCCTNTYALNNGSTDSSHPIQSLPVGCHNAERIPNLRVQRVLAWSIAHPTLHILHFAAPSAGHSEPVSATPFSHMHAFTRP